MNNDSITKPNSLALPASSNGNHSEASAEAKFPFANELRSFLQDSLDTDRSNSQLSRSFRAFYKVRSLVPIFVRQILQQIRNRKSPVSKSWYLPEQLLKFVKNISPTKSIWPDAAQFSFVLTHDVETQDGMAQIPKIAEMEQELGFRSSWNIVPYKYRVDRGLVKELQARGFEVGVHGYNHDGKLFLSKKIFDRRVPKINQAIEDFGATGFRAPMVHRNLDWLQQLNIQYDSSCFDVDPFQAMPGGLQSVWPFVFGKFVELPYTLPQDHTLLITLGETNDRIWRDKLSQIIGLKGMALMLTHPDYLETDAKLNIYRSFLEHAKENHSTGQSSYWHALPKDVASYTKTLCEM